MIEKIDLELVRKYDRPGPRYTSYPTAPLFSEDLGVDALVEAFARTYDTTSALSLYVHIPFCHQLCWYCGCNMKVSRNREAMDAHFRLIKNEIERIRPHINPAREARQVHLGGGTPNYLEADRLIEILEHLGKHFKFSEDAEISIELDPRQLDKEKIEALHKAGFNRVSLGVQDLDPGSKKRSIGFSPKRW